MTLWAREEVTWNGECQVLPASVFCVTNSLGWNERIPSNNSTASSQRVPTCAAASSLSSARSEQCSKLLPTSLAAVVPACLAFPWQSHRLWQGTAAQTLSLKGSGRGLVWNSAQQSEGGKLTQLYSENSLRICNLDSNSNKMKAESMEHLPKSFNFKTKPLLMRAIEEHQGEMMSFISSSDTEGFERLFSQKYNCHQPSPSYGTHLTDHQRTS